MADQFDTWKQLLALAQQHKTKAALREAINASGIKLVNEEPLPGYYRCAAVKDGPLLPVAIWRDGGQLYIYRGGQPVAAERVWPYCVWTPVPYDWYEAAAERGEKWPDEAAEAEVQAQVAGATIMQPGPTSAGGKSIEQMRAENPNIDRDLERTFAMADKAAGRSYEGPARGIGDNNPPVEDEVSALRNQIEAAKGVADRNYQEITSDDEAAAAQAMRSRLNGLSGDADKKREAEKRPHLDECRAIDGRWMPLVKMAKDAADKIRSALKVWENKKLDAERDAEREAARKRLAEEAKVASEAAARAEGEPEPVETLPAAHIPAAAAPAVIKGATGRAASVRMVKVARITDQDAAYQHLKAIPELRTLILKLAQRQIDAGHSVPGVEIDERRDVA